MSSNNRWILLLVLASTAPAWPQVKFEVASIRPSQPDLTARNAHSNFHGDRFEANAMTVGDILDMLNGYKLFQVVGGPDWMRKDRFDIVTKADRPIKEADRQSAVMALLAERFHLQSHRETREVPGIVLRAPKTPRGLKPAAGDERYSIGFDHGDYVFTAVTMSSVTNRMSQAWQAPVVDETELKGLFDFRLAISQIQSQPQMSWGDRIRDAMEEIGFRVENRRISLEVTVVDRCERPNEN